MSALLLFEVLVGAALVAVFAQTVANVFTIPRLGRHRRGPLKRPSVSVLIPARNEARAIGPCLRAWSRQDYPDYEIIVFDDDSTDRTAEYAAALARRRRGIRVIPGGALPEGWRGKPYACHRLAGEARGDLLVFADVDVRPTPATLGATVAAQEALRVDALSAVPRHIGRRRAVQALVALQNWAALSFVPSWPQRMGWRGLVTAMNGQFMVIRRDVYDAAGGFEAVRGALGEDVAFGRRLAHLGYRVGLLDGSAMLTCEPYATVRGAWMANARNLLPAFFGSVPVLSVVLALLVAAYFGPIAVLVSGAITGQGGARWLWVPLGELALGLGSRWITDRRAGYPGWLALTHPFAVGSLIAMGLTSIIWFRWRHEVEWRGRRYSVTRAA